MYVAIRDNMLEGAGYGDPFQGLSELNVESVEIRVDRNLKTPHFLSEGNPYDLASDGSREDLMEKLAESGVKICALLMGNDLTSDEVADEVAWLKNTCEAARKMGVNMIRVDIRPPEEGLKEEELIVRCASIFKDLLAANEAIEFGVENHGTANKKEFLDGLLDGVGSVRFGLTLDSGNFYWYGYPLSEVYAIMEHFVSRVKHTHFKNISYPQDTQEAKREVGWEYAKYVSPIYAGDVDHAKVISILKNAGYDRGLTIEDESLGKFPEGERREVLKKDVEHLKSLL